MAAQSGHPLLTGGRISSVDKIVAVADAVQLIRDGATVATGGFVGIGFAEAVAAEVEWLSLPLAARLTYDPADNVFFINFEGFSVRRREDVERIRRVVEERLAPLGRKVPAIVNYDHFTIAPDLLEAYTDMVGDLVARFYSGVTRYTTSAFMHMKFGEALRRRGVAPHIYESRAEAEAHLLSLTGGGAPAGRRR